MTRSVLERTWTQLLLTVEGTGHHHVIRLLLKISEWSQDPVQTVPHLVIKFGIYPTYQLSIYLMQAIILLSLRSFLPVLYPPIIDDPLIMIQQPWDRVQLDLW